MLLSAEDSLVQDYLNADSTKRFDFEKRYGKRNMDKMVEDFESDKYLKSNSMRCPSCKIAIEVRCVVILLLFSGLTRSFSFRKSMAATR